MPKITHNADGSVTVDRKTYDALVDDLAEFAGRFDASQEGFPYPLDQRPTSRQVKAMALLVGFGVGFALRVKERIEAMQHHEAK